MKLIISIFILITLLYVVSAQQINPVIITTNISDDNFIMIVDPNGNEIAGMQSNFIYDARFISINFISEGDFISQNGNFSTFYNSGIINPTKIINTFNVIIGKHNTTIPGSFVIINLTGNGCIIPYNIKISDPDGNPTDFEVDSYCDLKFGTISGSVNTR